MYLILVHVHMYMWHVDGMRMEYMGARFSLNFQFASSNTVHSANTTSGIAIVIGYSMWVRSISSYAVHSVLCTEPTMPMVEAKRLEDSDTVMMLATETASS